MAELYDVTIIGVRPGTRMKRPTLSAALRCWRRQIRDDPDRRAAARGPQQVDIYLPAAFSPMK